MLSSFFVFLFFLQQEFMRFCLSSDGIQRTFCFCINTEDKILLDHCC